MVVSFSSQPTMIHLAAHTVLLAVLQSFLVKAIPIDNGVKGYPQVTCGPHSIIVDIETARPFEGRIYVKGESHIKECVKTFGPAAIPPGPAVGVYGNGPLPVPALLPLVPDKPGYAAVESTVGLEIGFGQCNMRRTRTLFPRGVEYTFTMVVSFHPFFITKVDKAYRIKCFYMEAEKTVSANLDVSMLTTAQINQQFPMPQCQYNIRRGGPDGPLVRYAKVGDALYHVFSCDKAAGWVYGMLVKSCYVDDGQGSKFQLINEKGCSLDRHLVGDLIYDDLLISAFVESHVFKYADKPSLYFTCTVELCFKADGGCLGKTPPQCGVPLPTIPVYGSIAPPPPPIVPHIVPQIPEAVPYPIAPVVPAALAPLPVPGPYYGRDSPLEDTDSVRNGSSLASGRKTTRDSDEKSVKQNRKRDAKAVVEHMESDKINREREHAAADRSLRADEKPTLETDVVANSVVVLPFEDHPEYSSDPNDVELPSFNPAKLAVLGGDNGGICLSPTGFGMLLALFLTLFLFSMIVIALLVKARIQQKML